MIRERLRFSQQEFAERLGLSFTTYRNYEYRKPPPALLEKARTMLRGLETLTAAPSGVIPRLGAIGANTRGPIYAGDDGQMEVPIRFARPEYTGVSVQANEYSMLPYIQPGDTLVFKKGSRMDRFVAVRLQGETLPVCKKLTIDAGRAVLRSTNPDYEDIPAEGHEILGYCVGIIPADDRLSIGPDDAGISENYLRDLLSARLP